MTEADKFKTVKFVCAKCGAEDFEKVFPDEQHARAINCHECKAGRGMPDVRACVASGNGMFPVSIEAEPIFVPPKTNPPSYTDTEVQF